MKLKRLLKNILLEVKGSKEIEITGISSDSRSIGPGNLFIAKKGASFDGTRFIPQAVQNGATCVVTDIYDPFLGKITQVIHQDIQELESVLADRYYGNPSQHLFVVGITGTNGKTTTSYLVKHLLDHIEMPAGLIGTIETIIKDTRIPSVLTTPDVVTNHKLLKEMQIASLKAAVLEVSSHALDQNRVQKIDFDAAIYLNLSPEHLDYHKTMEAYKRAKRKLFEDLKPDAHAFICTDDPYCDEMMAHTPANVHTFGLLAGEIRAEITSTTLNGTEFFVVYKGEKILFSTPLLGTYNVMNLLAVISLGMQKGFSLPEMADIFQKFRSVPGRLQRVSQKPYVFVDFAHTEDALLKTLLTLKELQKGRIITVFGCGGDRDKVKRPKMAKVSESVSDFTIVTSDNPRTEDPEAICREIIKGFTRNQYFVEVDRKKAIEKAVEMANPKDIVLIAGKGHEKTQIFDHQTRSFDDVLVAKRALGG